LAKDISEGADYKFVFGSLKTDGVSAFCRRSDNGPDPRVRRRGYY